MFESKPPTFSTDKLRRFVKGASETSSDGHQRNPVEKMGGNDLESEASEERLSLKKWGSELWEIVKILLISVVIVLPIRYYVVQPFIVRGPSMEPNFHDREYLVVDELSYQFRAPKRGEAIVFRYPRDPRQFFIKRIIGLPGERVVIKDGRITVVNEKNPDGFTLEESYLVPRGRLTYPDTTRVLQDNEYFVLGDNRDASSDSRLWGPLPRIDITGRVLFRAWPPARFGTIPDFSTL